MTQQALIGPALMPAYAFTLKLAIVGGVGAVLAVGAIGSLLAGAPEPMATALVGAVKAAFVAFGATTIVFALAERHPGRRSRLSAALARLR
jgi:hypothetical protein